jgi:TRAP-type mannitol/chloroaromatic compound transport system permease large subunit
MITGPIFAPVVQFLGFDLVWFGVAFIVNMEMAYLTPPFGMNLFYMKGVAPKSITMNDIVHSVWPFVACQLFCLILVMVFPQLILWLPVRLFRS